MKYSGARILIECLKKEGVEVIFGYPGGVVLPIFDELYDAGFNFVLTRHEQAAAHAADGYARSTGKVGVCLVTSGPGATNIVTGLATAYMDSIPIVAITGQVKTTLIGNDAFQEADVTGITRPITKYNYLVKDVTKLAKTVKEAFFIASTGRPGPVLIDIPVDVSNAQAEFEYPKDVKLRSYNPTLTGHPQQIEKAAKLIAKSKKPVIYAGGGIVLSGASDELRKFAEKINAPVANTLLGLGGFAGTHDLFLGMLGMHGTAYANYAVSECDLLIALGARFDDRVTGKIDEFAPKSKIIHVDIDPSAISKNVSVDIPIVGDVKTVLASLNKIVGECDTKEWLGVIAEWKRKYPLRYANDDKLRPQYVIEEIYNVTKGKSIITTEVGQHQMWAAQYFKYDKPRTFISSGGLGTMGYGFPSAMGASLGRKDAVVFCIAGDGSIQMNIQELATCIGYKIPVKIAILNNGFLGMVRQWQELFYDKRYSFTTLKNSNPDFVKLAEAYGACGIRVKQKKDVKSAIQKAIETEGVVIIDFVVEAEENVFPMVPAGKANNQMIDMA